MIESANQILADVTLQDRVLVEADLGGQITGFRAVVVKVAPDEIWLGLPAQDRRLEAMGEGKRLRLTVTREGGALVAQTRFLRHLSQCRIFAVEKPSRIERVQRRAHRRVALQLEARLRMLNPGTGMVEGKGFSGRTVDVSTGGVLVETDMPLNLGDEVDLTLMLAATDRVSTTGKVTGIRDLAGGAAASSSQGTPGVAIGLKFLRMTTVDEDRILRRLLLAEHRREAGPAPLSFPVKDSDLEEGPEPESKVLPPGTPLPVARTFAVPVPAAPPAAPPADPKAPAEAAAPPPARPPVPTPASAKPKLPVVPAADEPLIAVGLRLCEEGDVYAVRCWFDSLPPPDRIGVLSRLQENLSGSPVPGVPEGGGARPLASALGLI